MSGKKMLLIEGPDDKHVLWALLARHASVVPSGSFDIREKGGKDGLLDEVPLQIKARNVARMAVALIGWLRRLFVDP